MERGLDRELQIQSRNGQSFSSPPEQGKGLRLEWAWSFEPEETRMQTLDGASPV